MGAYGSPELYPNNNDYEYKYQSPNQPPYKQKRNTSSCLTNFFAVVGIASIIIFIVMLLVNGVKNSQKVNNQPTVSQSVYIPPLISSTSNSISVPNDSTEYLQSWAKAVILQYLLYPDSAKFSDNLSDWKIVRDGKSCTITSVVYARGKSSKQVTSGSFTVKVAYDSKFNAAVSYISIDDKVLYDLSSSKATK